MYINFITDNYNYEIFNIENVRNNNIRVYFLNNELPINIKNVGFNVYSDEGELLNSYEEYTTIFNTQDNYIEYTNNSNIFYDYLVPDENGYIVNITMRINNDSEEGLYLYRSGTTLEYMEWEFNIFDEYVYPLYKIIYGELTETSEEERKSHREKIFTIRLEQAKNEKIEEINSACNKLITDGVIIDGERFSYTLEDQTNIMSALQNIKMTDMSVPYHSNGNNFRMFSQAEIISIYTAQYKNLIQHTIYSNQLKLYIKNELSTIDDIKAINYGDALTGHYLDNYNSIVNQAIANMETNLDTLNNT